MTLSDDTILLRRRLVIAGILALAGIALSVADRLVPATARAAVNDFASAHGGSKEINAEADALLGQYKIDPKGITTWKVMTPDKKFLRLEQRAVVPHDFATVEFNHKLNQRILPYGAHVAATERSKENVVTMHILNQGVIIRTISFAMRPYDPSERVKEVGGKETKGKEKNIKEKHTAAKPRAH
jgi:hypothetical protein